MKRKENDSMNKPSTMRVAMEQPYIVKDSQHENTEQGVAPLAENKGKHDGKTKEIRLYGEWVNVTSFLERGHPGGNEVLEFYLGQDGTDAFDAFHVGTRARNILKSLPRVADRQDEPCEVEPVVRHFRALRKKWEKNGYFEPKPWVEILWAIIALSGACLVYNFFTLLPGHCRGDIPPADTIPYLCIIEPSHIYSSHGDPCVCMVGAYHLCSCPCCGHGFLPCAD